MKKKSRKKPRKASNKGSGAIAQDGSIAAGAGGVAIGGNLYGDIHLHGSSASSPNPRSELGTLFGVPNLPPRYLERDDYLDQFREALLSEETQTVGIAGKPQYVGVQGMGGLGKSVLAAALAWDEQVRRAFPDGIFWLRFGQEVDEAGVLELQKEILLVLAPDSQPESPAQGRNLLNLALQGKHCLIIADDLWDSSHLNHFDLADSGCRFLLTTRDAEVIQGTGAHLCELHLLTNEQARELLAKCSGFAEKDLPEEAEAILQECGRLPLAVAAIGSMVNGKGRSYWQLALKKLQTARLDKIPTKFDRYSGYETLFKVFQVSVEDLPHEVQDYFKTLIVFPEDAEIPESVLQLYWEHIGQGEYEPLDAVNLLAQRSLLTFTYDEFGTNILIHDLIRDYLFCQNDEITMQHRRLLASFVAAYPGGWHKIPYEESCYPDKPASYFYMKWTIHARAACDPVLSEEIASDLIFHQKELSPVELRKALEFVDYDFAAIAPRLLEEHTNRLVIQDCLRILGDNAKGAAHRLLKQSSDNRLLIHCLTLLGKEAKEDARYLLKSSNDEWLSITCIRILGEEADASAKKILRESKDTSAVTVCLRLLGEKSKNDAKRLLKESKQPTILTACLDILGNTAKEDAQDLLESSRSEWLTLSCIRILGKDAEHAALMLIKNTRDKSIKEECQKIVLNWQDNRREA
ncbi:hypothetical protein GMJAKD_10465 [Candidatus Electrothrix aarhusensis]